MKNSGLRLVFVFGVLFCTFLFTNSLIAAQNNAIIYSDSIKATVANNSNISSGILRPDIHETPSKYNANPAARMAVMNSRVRGYREMIRGYREMDANIPETPKDDRTEKNASPSAFPNPAVNKVTIQMSGTDPLLKVEIFDKSGVLKFEEVLDINPWNPTTHTLNISELLPGVYTVRAYTAKGPTKPFRIMVTR